jgi:hypothetical protein
MVRHDYISILIADGRVSRNSGVVRDYDVYSHKLKLSFPYVVYRTAKSDDGTAPTVTALQQLKSDSSALDLAANRWDVLLHGQRVLMGGTSVLSICVGVFVDASTFGAPNMEKRRINSVNGAEIARTMDVCVSLVAWLIPCHWVDSGFIANYDYLRNTPAARRQFCSAAQPSVVAAALRLEAPPDLAELADAMARDGAVQGDAEPLHAVAEGGHQQQVRCADSFESP